MIERNVHHRGKTPSRTFLADVEYSTLGGKWSVRFETYLGIPGSENMVRAVTSAPLFNTEDEAYAAGDRALDLLQATDAFPNMCVPW